MYSKIRASVFCFLLWFLATSLFAQEKIRLNDHWEFIRQDFGGVWEAVRPVGKGNPESVPLWDSVSLPHCFNAKDAVDPNVNYYQGPSWYRTQLKIENPFSNGRTLLHFEGVGQKTEVYIYTTKVGAHVGGYDEWTVDITDAVAQFSKTEIYKSQFKGKIPLSIRVDNSRDLEMIPSDLSDFNIYGGIYRYLNLVYSPAFSIDKIFTSVSVDEKGKVGTVKIDARFYNPTKITKASAEMKLIDQRGKVIESKEVLLKSLEGEVQLGSFQIKKPLLWSPDKPTLYTLEVITKTDQGESKYFDRIGFRNFEFVEKGTF